MSNKFAAKDISNGSLNQITTTGFYFGSNITEVTPYIKSHKWCLINAYVSGNSASIFVTAGDAMALSIYRNGDGIYSYYPIATKSDFMCGESIVPMNAGSTNVTFPQAFCDIPVVVAVARGSSKNVLYSVKVENISKSGFMVTAAMLDNGSATSPSYDVTVEWIAMRKA